MAALPSVRFTLNVLVPGWITVFGLVCLTAPAAGVVASVSLFVVGIVVIPALAVISGAVRARASISTTHSGSRCDIGVGPMH